MTVTLTQLEYIVALDKLRNFRAAAKSCHVTQPTLSMQIQKLEDDLGVTIFDRSTQPIQATPIGQKIIDQSRVVLSQSTLISELIDQERNEIKGELRLAVIPTLAPYILPLFVGKFLQEFPKLTLSVEESKTEDIIKALEKNQIDVGLLVTPLGEKLLREYPLFREPFYVYVAKGSKLAKLSQIDDKDLQEHDLLLLSEGHCMREQMLRACRKNRSSVESKNSRLRFESGSIETLCHLAETGHGYTVIPHLATAWDTPRTGRVIPFSNPQPSREVSLAVHHSFARDSVLQALISCIRSVLPKVLTGSGMVTLTKNKNNM